MTWPRSLRPAPRHRRRRLHRLVLRPRRPGPRRRDPDHGPRQADLRRQPLEPRRGRGRPGAAARLRFVQGDIADPDVVGPLVADADAVVNFAAESHVDRSILDPEAFLRTGVVGVHVLLEAVREASAGRSERRSLPPGLDRRGLRLGRGRPVPRDATGSTRARPTRRSRRPASCSCSSYVATHGVDAVVTRGANTYGPYHHPEKLIPLFITNALDDQPLPLYGDGLQRRDWLFVADHAGAIDHVLRHGATGETYNLPGSAEMTNRDVVAALLERLGKPWSLVRSVPDRPGHDRRYALDGVEARGARLAEPGLVRRRAGGDRRLVSGRTSRGGGPRSPATGTPTTSASTGRRLAAVDGGLSAVRVAVTGAGGRLGRALVEALEDAPFTGLGRADRLDAGRVRPRRARTGSTRSSTATGPRSSSTPRPGPTSTAAPATRTWRRRRNGDAVHVLAEATRGPRHRPRPRLTNEVFDGRRTDGRGYGPDDPTNPINPYGASKLAGESRRHGRLSAAAAARLGIVRTAWLYGPPGNDFPTKILAAAERAPRRRRAAQGRRRRGRLADVQPRTSPRRSSSCSARATSAGSTTS